ncbi:MAG: site-2 protease family protein [Bacteroidetes bacterium]|nr:MAG: site-2 protease family protein [Bacteroidota bacterium]
MEKKGLQDKRSLNPQFRDHVLCRIAPVILFILTIYTAITNGVFFFGNKFELSTSIWKGIPYALAILLIMGTHALGHYIAARFHGVRVYPPYFIPFSSVIGTVGAYTKMHWPISGRRALIIIFTAGPIASFCVSWIILIIGLFLSEIKDVSTNNVMGLWEPLILRITSLAIFGSLPDTKDIMLHPVAYAGWIGMFYNFLHLLPIGRFDGGRLVYALWGYRVMQWISFVSIGILLLLGFFWFGWFIMAIMGVIHNIRLRRQYPSDQYNEPIERSMKILIYITVVIFIISFIPAPYR